MKIIEKKIYEPFEESLENSYFIDSDYLFSLNKQGKFLYKIKIKDNPPQGGLALGELLKPNKMSDLLLDVGTGTGVISIRCALNGFKRIIATEISECECNLAKFNIKQNDLDDNVSILRMDLASALLQNRFNFIVANLPQLPSLNIADDKRNYGGITGFETIDRIIKQSKYCLVKGGELWLYVIDFLGVINRNGSEYSLFERLEMNGFKPEIVLRLSRKFSKQSHLNYAYPQIKKKYPNSDFSKKYPSIRSYKTYIVKGILRN